MEKNDKVIKETAKGFKWNGLKKKDLVLLFLAGILLAFGTVPKWFTKEESKKDDNLPVTKQIKTESTTNRVGDMEYVEYYEKKLKKILEMTEGVGKAEVVITLNTSKEQVVLKDYPYSEEKLNETDQEGGSRVSSQVHSEEATVLVQTPSGQTSPYVTKEIEAQIEGVVVLAQGGKDAYVVTAIVNACEALFDVPAHKVRVLTMQTNN